MLKTTITSGKQFSNAKVKMHHIIKSLGAFDILWPYMRESENSAYVQGEQASGAICRHDLAANFDPMRFSRETNQDIEKQINDIWLEKCTLNPRLYNGTKFRYNGGEVIGKKYVLNVGLTSYKDLCGTNLSKNFKKILELGRNNTDNSQAFMSDPIGVGVLLITDDGYGVVTRRAAWTGEFPGLLDRPGGHPEPEKILTPEGNLKPEFGQKDINEIVMEEIWTSAAQEAEDELGIDKSKLEDMRFLGISINNESGGRPSLEFFARLRMKSQKIRELYNLGKQSEADESTALHFVPRHTLKMMPFFFLEHEKLDKGASNYDTSRESNSLKSRDQPADTENAVNIENILDVDKNAQSLLAEATPALKAAIMLVHYHKLFEI